jgi:hypothetical protein
MTGKCNPLGKRRGSPLAPTLTLPLPTPSKPKKERRLCDKDKDLKEFDGQLYRPSKMYLQGSDAFKFKIKRTRLFM